MKSRYEKLQKQFDAYKWETEALKMHCEKLTEERDQLKSRFEEAALELQQKTGDFFFLKFTLLQAIFYKS